MSGSALRLHPRKLIHVRRLFLLLISFLLSSGEFANHEDSDKCPGCSRVSCQPCGIQELDDAVVGLLLCDRSTTMSIRRQIRRVSRSMLLLLLLVLLLLLLLMMMMMMNDGPVSVSSSFDPALQQRVWCLVRTRKRNLV